MYNHLQNEKSPYLLQHAQNPVDWYPWTAAAFAKAQKEQKPIFLSIGYATCHWCHVMTEESFMDEQVASYLNEHFIAIKVDREERPDVDAVYMQFCQSFTGFGGWPLSVFLTPTQKPIFAATYLPKENFLLLLQEINHMWQTERAACEEASQSMTFALAQSIQQELEKPRKKKIGKKELCQTLCQKAVAGLKQHFDPVYGGFSDVPKFPAPQQMLFLLQYAEQTADKAILPMVEKTLQQMARGGIFDQIGFGFSRYSTDREWLVPHFEKMLYDNALLAMVYLECYRITKKDFYQDMARKIFFYVEQEMMSDYGGFYTAQDADSVEGEGAFYLFTLAEVMAVLGEQDGPVFCNFYGIDQKGNFDGKNIVNLLSQKQWEKIPQPIDRMRQKLYRYRQKRMALRKDDKILTSWNALMIAALAKGSLVLREENYLLLAKRAFAFLEETMTDQKGFLYARFWQGSVGIPAYLDDYAFAIWAARNLYMTTCDTVYLQKALLWQQQLLDLFYDTERAGFYLTSTAHDDLIFRPKEYYDGAMPAGNSVAFVGLQYLATLSRNQTWQKMTENCFSAYLPLVEANPTAYCFLLLGFLNMAYPETELIAVLGQQEEKKNLMDWLGNQNTERLVLVAIEEKNMEQIKSMFPHLRDYVLKPGESKYYFCTEQRCLAPVKSLEKQKK